MKRIAITFVTLLAATGHFFAQGAADGIRFAQTNSTGSARSVGVGSSMAALGGDMGTIHINPAAIGTYRTSEFTFSPFLRFNNSNTSLNLGNNTNENITVGGMAGAGFVVASTREANDWKAVNFGITYNRMAGYLSNTKVKGTTANSIVNFWEKNADGIAHTELNQYDGTLMAYNNYLIDDTYTLGNDYTSVVPSTAEVLKNQTINEKGGISEMSVTLGGNYKDKLYIGGSFTPSFFRYTYNELYKESGNENTPDFESLSYTDYYQTSGAGVKGSIGFIYKISQLARVGASWQTPTFYKLKDEYKTSLTSSAYWLNGLNVREPKSGTQESQVGKFQYFYSAPMRLNVHTGFVLGKTAFVSAEAEWLNYGRGKYNYTQEDGSTPYEDAEQAVNDEIRNSFQHAFNFKVGGECTFDIFRLRAGYGIGSSPYQKFNFNMKESGTQTISGGAGIRINKFALDIAYRHEMTQNNYALYPQSETNNQVARSRKANGLVVLTLGFRFE